jgi:hypothetical protein
MNDDKQAIKDNTGYYIVAQGKPHQKMQGITKMLVMVSYNKVTTHSQDENVKMMLIFNHVTWRLGLGLDSWCLTSLSTIFQLYRGSQFY